MFNMNRRSNRPIGPPIGLPTQIIHVHSSVSYHWATFKKYDRHGHASPIGYGPLVVDRCTGSGIRSHRFFFIISFTISFTLKVLPMAFWDDDKCLYRLYHERDDF